MNGINILEIMTSVFIFALCLIFTAYRCNRLEGIVVNLKEKVDELEIELRQEIQSVSRANKIMGRRNDNRGTF